MVYQFCWEMDHNQGMGVFMSWEYSAAEKLLLGIILPFGVFDNYLYKLVQLNLEHCWMVVGKVNKNLKMCQNPNHRLRLCVVFSDLPNTWDFVILCIIIGTLKEYGFLCVW